MTRTATLAASVMALLVGVATAPVRAQSAFDGFNPAANLFVNTEIADFVPATLVRVTVR